ncbi:amidase [Thalassobaculum sp. OXR-137]|uniref:amidase n=1 Tax=Thalassobaculum sp. OXR-137 TaxID=3100173 RepID=UPI002AC9C8BA|nr:amidase [Thalassobaculum sp. OXR-137]WPZ33866.1 amidase [Thalassobaculum sp. OXR-137]
MSALLDLSIAELGRGYRDGSVSPVAVTEAALERIEATNDALHSFNTVTADLALARAAAAETELAAGTDLGPMHGVPFGVKDIYNTEGVLTTCQSHLRSEFVPDANAHSVQLLLDGGAVMLGKCATIEFATGAPNDETFFPPARNPWNLEHIPGGSSSGSGAAVAVGITRMALGSDTGGSIRGPAALCGTVGMKPTYGRVSRRGVFPLSYTMDHCGPLSWSVEDSAIALTVMAGFDPLDPACADVPVPDYTAVLNKGVAGKKIAFVEHWIEEEGTADPEAVKALHTALDVLRSEGATVETVQLSPYDLYQACARLLVLPECYAIHEHDLIERPELYGRPTRERLMAGAFVRGSDYVEALRVRRELAIEVNNVILGQYDALIAPCSVVTAGRFDSLGDDPMKLSGMMTQPFNVTGSPAMSVCTGYHSNGLPLSMQIVGKAFDEATVFQVGAAYEAATEWRKHRPSMLAARAAAAE